MPIRAKGGGSALPPLPTRLRNHASLRRTALSIAISSAKPDTLSVAQYESPVSSWEEDSKTKAPMLSLDPSLDLLALRRMEDGIEMFFADLYFASVGMEETITEMQAADVQACSKHYIGNEQETQRNPNVSVEDKTIEAIASNIHDQTMHQP
ncbi:uncharacterized protein BDZ99DRAFT_514045 [Mytilinidion resinicola]|uniref:Glycoside hydrolase n=1 Tax=Mytilinidion resinicola TaxID=574789 RepID=A0A6A6Z9W7_9PEZI|nr:uncharacterized protein BDZ99DRAFT_514045 [Mytilinidion resinicola]KAF2817830.1 hypothetical protein BDZ99DRAFT_514045 [Mytilinidion resinicola]